MDDKLEKANFKMKKARISLQKDFPFFSDILFFMELIPSDDVETMGINASGRVFYNPGFVSKLSFRELRGVLVHEAVHPSWLHITRGMKKSNRGVWNLAADCHANMMVVKQGLVLPNCVACSPDMYNDEVKVIVGSFSYTVKNIMTKPTEAVYDELMNNMPESLKNILKNGGNNGGVDVHSYDGASNEDIQRIEGDWKQRVTNAAERARQAGKFPAGMERFVGDLLEPKVDWRTIIYQFMVGGLPSDRSFLKRDRRYAAHGLYIPEVKKESVDVFNWIDSSGSISDKDVSEFKTELVGFKRAFNNVSMKLGFCDDRVYTPVLEFDDVEEEDIMKAKVKGGGGTDMRKCIKYCKDHSPDTETVIILTDGYTPFPNIEDIPQSVRLLWVVSSNGIKEAPKNVPGDFVFITND